MLSPDDLRTTATKASKCLYFCRTQQSVWVWPHIERPPLTLMVRSPAPFGGERAGPSLSSRPAVASSMVASVPLKECRRRAAKPRPGHGLAARRRTVRRARRRPNGSARRLVDRYVGSLATGGETRLRPLSTRWACPCPARPEPRLARAAYLCAKALSMAALFRIDPL